MARHCIREPRYVPPVQRIGEQPDLFGGPTLSHVAERQGPPKGWQRQLQKWGRCTVIADLEAAPPSVIDPPPSPAGKARPTCPRPLLGTLTRIQCFF